MNHSLCSLSIRKKYKNLSNTFSWIILKNNGKLKIVCLLLVYIHWRGLLVNDWKALKMYNLLFFWFLVGQDQGQCPNANSWMLESKGGSMPGLTHRAIFFEIVFINLDCKICVYFNRCQHIMFTIYDLFRTIATKIIGCVWRDIKTIPRQCKDQYLHFLIDIIDRYSVLIDSQVKLKISHQYVKLKLEIIIKCLAIDFSCLIQLFKNLKPGDLGILGIHLNITKNIKNYHTFSSNSLKTSIRWSASNNCCKLSLI